MLESTIKVFSKGQQDDCYNIHNRVHYIATDLKNAEKLMQQGRFFDAMDLIRQSNINAQITEEAIATFVKGLQEAGLWGENNNAIQK